MSAYLDKSQLVTFSFSNAFEIYKKAKESDLESPFVLERPKARVIKASDPSVQEFKPAELKPTNKERTFEVPMGVREAEEKARNLKLRSMENLQKNLNELTDAHEKLRFLLQELDVLTKKKG